MSWYRAIWSAVCVFALASCGSAPPPAAAPSPEPEPEPEEVAPEPPPQIPLEERIRAPFAVQSSGQPAPRELRSELVVLDASRRAPASTAAGANGVDTAAAQPARGSASASAPSGARTPATGSAAATQPSAAAPRPAAAGGARPAAPRQHEVQRGETFYGVARRYGVTPMALAAANPGVDANRIQAGQVLRLPEGARTQATPATPGSTGAAQPPRTPPAAPRQTAQRTHRVEAGETLWGIARRYGVTPEQIRTANRMTDETVRIGQTLVIPNR